MYFLGGGGGGGGGQERLLSDNALVHQLNFTFEVIDN